MRSAHTTPSPLSQTAPNLGASVTGSKAAACLTSITSTTRSPSLTATPPWTSIPSLPTQLKSGSAPSTPLEAKKCGLRKTICARWKKLAAACVLRRLFPSSCPRSQLTATPTLTALLAPTEESPWMHRCATATASSSSSSPARATSLKPRRNRVCAPPCAWLSRVFLPLPRPWPVAPSPTTLLAASFSNWKNKGEH